MKSIDDNDRTLLGDVATGDPRPSVVDVLQKARALIERPENWAKGVFENDGCYCLDGALIRAWNLPITDDYGSPYWGAYSALKATIAVESVWDWNDAPERTHPEVLAAFDKAIAAELAKAGAA